MGTISKQILHLMKHLSTHTSSFEWNPQCQRTNCVLHLYAHPKFHVLLIFGREFFKGVFVKKSTTDVYLIRQKSNWMAENDNDDDNDNDNDYQRGGNLTQSVYQYCKHLLQSDGMDTHREEGSFTMSRTKSHKWSRNPNLNRNNPKLEGLKLKMDGFSWAVGSGR